MEQQAGRRVPASRQRRQPAQQSQYTMPSDEEQKNRQRQYHEDQKRRSDYLHGEAARAARIRDEAAALGITLEPDPGCEWSGMVGGSQIKIGSRAECNAPFAFLKGHIEEVW